MFCKTGASFFVIFLLVLAVSWTRSEGDKPKDDESSSVYAQIHEAYDKLDENPDGYVSFDEIKRALGNTSQEDWNEEIKPHDVDGDQRLTPEEFENWLTSFKKDEL